jgi:hypothetical protein
VSDIWSQPRSEDATGEVAGAPPQADAPPVRKRGGRLVLAVVAVIVLVAAMVGALLWFEFTRSPTYSLVKLGDAVQAKDWNGVQKYVDIDAVVGQAVDEAVGKAAGGGNSALAGLGAEVGNASKPALVAQAKALLKQGVEQGTGPVLPNQSLLVSAFITRQVKSVTYAGDEALATVEVPLKTGAPLELKLRMKGVGDYWRVVAVNNIEALVGALGK